MWHFGIYWQTIGSNAGVTEQYRDLETKRQMGWTCRQNGWREAAEKIVELRKNEDAQIMGPLNVKVNLSLGLSKHHAIKTYLGSVGIAPRILNIGTRWRRVVSFMPHQLYLGGKSPHYPLDRKVGGPQSRSGRGGEEKTISHLLIHINRMWVLSCNINVYPKVSGLASCSENCNWCSSLPLGAVVLLFCESV
jgi:hypothetical protein